LHCCTSSAQRNPALEPEHAPILCYAPALGDRAKIKASGIEGECSAILQRVGGCELFAITYAASNGAVSETYFRADELAAPAKTKAAKKPATR